MLANNPLATSTTAGAARPVPAGDAPASTPLPAGEGGEAPPDAGFNAMLLDFLRPQVGAVGDGIPQAALSTEGESSPTSGEDLPLAAGIDPLGEDPDGLPLFTVAPPLQLTELENGVIYDEGGKASGAFVRARFESLVSAADLNQWRGNVAAGRLPASEGNPAAGQLQEMLPGRMDAGSERSLGEGSLLGSLGGRDPVPGGTLIPAAGSAVPGATMFMNPQHGTQPNSPGLPEISTPVQHPSWAGQVNERLQWMIQHKLQQADIQLDPPELGRLDVRVVVNNDQANIHFASSHAAVRDALEAALPRLREMFQEQGLNLGNVDISQHNARDQQQGSEQSAGQGHVDATEDAHAEPGLETTARIGGITRGHGMLDVFA